MDINAAIEKELYDCKGYDINVRLVALTNSLLIYQGNVNQIISWYKKLNDPQAALIIWNPDNYELLEKTNLEMQRLFTNFLSSAFSLRDHLYVLKREYYIGTVVETKMDECIAKYFKDNNLTAFIQDFRNFVIHCGYPKTSKSLSFNSSAISNDIFFDAAQLNKFKNWTQGSKKFLDTMDTRVKLIDLVVDYDKIINNYYSAIFDILKDYNHAELEELKAIKDKYKLKLHMVRI